MKIHVTGASGFVGSALTKALVSSGHTLAPGIEGSDAVVHLAAIAHRRASPEEIERVNVGLTRQIGQAAASHGAAMVFLSSVKVHGEISPAPFSESSPFAPEDVYGESKVKAEEALRAIPGLRLAVLRPPLVYGPGVKANFLALMKAIARGWPLPLASIRNRRSLIYLGNLVDAILASLQKEGTFLVSDGEAYSTPQLCRCIGEALERPARLFAFPTAILPGKLTQSLQVDDSAIRRTLGWRPPFTPEEGLHATARWYRGR